MKNVFNAKLIGNDIKFYIKCKYHKQKTIQKKFKSLIY